MKKVTSIILILSFLLCLTACGSEKDAKSDAGSNDSSAQKTEEESSGDDAQSSGNYTLYDDLPDYEKIRHHEVYLSTPSWKSRDSSTGVILTNDQTDIYSLVLAYEPETAYTGSIENILDGMHDKYIEVLDRYWSADYADFSLDTKEIVTLDCGVEALHFEGALPGTLSGNTKDFPVYGYAFVYDDAPIIMSYFIKDLEKGEEYKEYATDIVDRIVKTVRTEP